MTEYKPTKTDIEAVANALIAVIDVLTDKILPSIKESVKSGVFDELIAKKLIDIITEEANE